MFLSLKVEITSFTWPSLVSKIRKLSCDDWRLLFWSVWWTGIARILILFVPLKRFSFLLGTLMKETPETSVTGDIEMLRLLGWTSAGQAVMWDGGLCCDGTLFNHANIKEHEQIASGFEFEIIERKKRAFKLACSYLNGKVCFIYQERPYTICEAFQFKLIKA